MAAVRPAGGAWPAEGVVPERLDRLFLHQEFREGVRRCANDMGEANSPHFRGLAHATALASGGQLQSTAHSDSDFFGIFYSLLGFVMFGPRLTESRSSSSEVSRHPAPRICSNASPPRYIWTIERWLWEQCPPAARETIFDVARRLSWISEIHGAPRGLLKWLGRLEQQTEGGAGLCWGSGELRYVNAQKQIQAAKCISGLTHLSTRAGLTGLSFQQERDSLNWIEEFLELSLIDWDAAGQVPGQNTLNVFATDASHGLLTLDEGSAALRGSGRRLSSNILLTTTGTPRDIVFLPQNLVDALSNPLSQEDRDNIEAGRPSSINNLLSGAPRATRRADDEDHGSALDAERRSDDGRESVTGYSQVTPSRRYRRARSPLWQRVAPGDRRAAPPPSSRGGPASSAAGRSASPRGAASNNSSSLGIPFRRRDVFPPQSPQRQPARSLPSVSSYQHSERSSSWRPRPRSRAASFRSRPVSAQNSSRGESGNSPCRSTRGGGPPPRPPSPSRSVSSSPARGSSRAGAASSSAARGRSPPPQRRTAGSSGNSSPSSRHSSSESSRGPAGGPRGINRSRSSSAARGPRPPPQRRTADENNSRRGGAASPSDDSSSDESDQPNRSRVQQTIPSSSSARSPGSPLRRRSRSQNHDRSRNRQPNPPGNRSPPARPIPSVRDGPLPNDRYSIRSRGDASVNSMASAFIAQRERARVRSQRPSPVPSSANRLNGNVSVQGSPRAERVPADHSRGQQQHQQRPQQQPQRGRPLFPDSPEQNPFGGSQDGNGSRGAGNPPPSPARRGRSRRRRRSSSRADDAADDELVERPVESWYDPLTRQTNAERRATARDFAYRTTSGKDGKQVSPAFWRWGLRFALSVAAGEAPPPEEGTLLDVLRSSAVQNLIRNEGEEIRQKGGAPLDGPIAKTVVWLAANGQRLKHLRRGPRTEGGKMSVSLILPPSVLDQGGNLQKILQTAVATERSGRFSSVLYGHVREETLAQVAEELQANGMALEQCAAVSANDLVAQGAHCWKNTAASRVDLTFGQLAVLAADCCQVEFLYDATGVLRMEEATKLVQSFDKSAYRTGILNSRSWENFLSAVAAASVAFGNAERSGGVPKNSLIGGNTERLVDEMMKALDHFPKKRDRPPTNGGEYGERTQAETRPPNKTVTFLEEVCKMTEVFGTRRESACGAHTYGRLLAALDDNGRKPLSDELADLKDCSRGVAECRFSHAAVNAEKLNAAMEILTAEDAKTKITEWKTSWGQRFGSSAQQQDSARQQQNNNSGGGKTGGKKGKGKGKKGKNGK